jgi:hypothetical protein
MKSEKFQGMSGRSHCADPDRLLLGGRRNRRAHIRSSLMEARMIEGIKLTGLTALSIRLTKTSLRLIGIQLEFSPNSLTC